MVDFYFLHRFKTHRQTEQTRQRRFVFVPAQRNQK